MCIIVAKKSGIKMPSMETLRTCFRNNPDGAGFMIAAKNAVYGFKGLMTFTELEDELKNAKKRFGSLDDLSVVLHFRISTHGSSIGGNTHPFPLKGGYRELRKSEWVCEQGFAHNGIIMQTSTDDDVKKHNVSDTMVFAKKYINPIAKHVNIATDHAIMDMLFELAGSKLCFLNKKGKIATRGKFFEHEGVLYSNYSFEKREYKFYLSDSFYDNFYPYSNGFSLKDEGLRLNAKDVEVYACDLAEEMGLYPITDDTMIVFLDGTMYDNNSDELLFIDEVGYLYRFDEDELDFIVHATPDEYNEYSVMQEDWK